MRYQQLICISNDNRLILYKKYLGRKNFFNDNFYFIYDKNKSLGLFYCNLFKTAEELRDERLNIIL